MQIQGVPDGYLERNPTAASVLLVIAVGIMVLAVYLLPSIVGRRKQKAGASQVATPGSAAPDVMLRPARAD
jgi:hypothetical protein